MNGEIKLSRHKAIIKATEERKIYYFGYARLWDNNKTITERTEKIGEKTLWEGEIDAPLIDEGETLRIEELNADVTITHRIRSTSGAYIYKTDYELDLIEDEKTAKTKNEAKLEEEKYLIAVEELNVGLAAEKELEPEDIMKKTS